MEDLIDYSQLTALVSDSIRSSIHARSDLRSITGYALLTAADLGSVFDAFCTEPLLFAPSDWPRVGGRRHFEPVAPLLARRLQLEDELDRESFTQNDRVFDSLVGALAAVRAEGLFAAHTFITVCVLGADSAREFAAIPRINPPEVVRAWRKARLLDSRSALQSIRAKGEPRAFSLRDLEARLLVEIANLEAEFEA